MTVSSYPLSWPEGWPRTASSARKRGRFGRSDGYGGRSIRGVTIADATQRVLSQLGMLGVRDYNAIISTNLTLRRDGLPLSGVREPSDSGAAVYWRAKSGVVKVMAVDTYDRVADNLAAIAATLDAMRAIERHGGAQILDRAFTGFTALPASRSAFDILGVRPGASRDEIEAAFRTKAKSAHPDMGGSSAAMAELNRARDEALRT